MSAALDVDTSILADIDFDPATPCESIDHKILARVTGRDEAAAWFAIVRCPECGDGCSFLLCEPCRLFKLKAAVTSCRMADGGCGFLTESWLDFVLVITRLDGASG